MINEHSLVPIFRRTLGGVILLILRNLAGIAGETGAESLSTGSSSGYWLELKRVLRCVAVVTSAEKSSRRFFAQFSFALLELPFECLLCVKLRAFENESLSLKLSGVSPLLRHSSSSVL